MLQTIPSLPVQQSRLKLLNVRSSGVCVELIVHWVCILDDLCGVVQFTNVLTFGKRGVNIVG